VRLNGYVTSDARQSGDKSRAQTRNSLQQLAPANPPTRELTRDEPTRSEQVGVIHLIERPPNIEAPFDQLSSMVNSRSQPMAWSTSGGQATSRPLAAITASLSSLYAPTTPEDDCHDRSDNGQSRCNELGTGNAHSYHLRSSRYWTGIQHCGSITVERGRTPTFPLPIGRHVPRVRLTGYRASPSFSVNHSVG
jgi:hypothetical protein